jgi:selenocysteine lyase/cysteine desulfurase
MDKRSFLKKASLLGVLPFTYPNFFGQSEGSSKLNKVMSAAEKSAQSPSDFWDTIRSQYALTTDYINLESGYYNIIPQPTLEKLKANMQRVNLEGSHYMRTKLDSDRRETTQALADFMGVPSRNLIITRNTTESLDLVIAGYPWQKGDHVIYALQDYGAMKVMFEQVVERHGLTQDLVSVPNHPKDDDEIVALYESQIKPNTKMIMVCHMINITGQILPIRKICDMAHSHGVEVLVDGAHCVGHFDFDLKDFNCDYYGSSLHKWLAAPLGNGLLYIEDERIAALWPLLADYIEDRSNILRLNHLGTHPAYITLGVKDAIDYLNSIGLKRKEERLRFLRTYWMDALKDVTNVVINTPWEPHRSCGIGNIGLSNLSPEVMAQRLLDEHGVFTVAIDYANVHGCRITPNVFTTTAELDHFIKAVKTLAQS